MDQKADPSVKMRHLCVDFHLSVCEKDVEDEDPGKQKLKGNRESQKLPVTVYKFATASMQKEIRVWELYLKDDLEVNLVANLVGHKSTTNVVRFSPDGQMIASGDIGGRVLIWKESPFQEPMEHDGDSSTIPPNKGKWDIAFIFLHKGEVTNLCWNPDSLMVASVSRDGSILCHKVDTGNRVWSVRGFRHFANGIVWDPRGKYVVTLSTDRHLDILDALKGNQLRNCLSLELSSKDIFEDVELQQRNYTIFHDDKLNSYTRAVEFSPCGSVVFAPAVHLQEGDKNVYGTFVFKRADFDKCEPMALIWNETPTIAVKCSPVYYELNKDVKENFLELPYRLVYAVMTKDAVIVYDSQRSDPIYYFHNPELKDLTSLSWSPDGKVLAISSMDTFITFISVDHRDIGQVCGKPPVEEDTVEILPVEKRKDQEKRVTIVGTVHEPSQAIKQPIGSFKFSASKERRVRHLTGSSTSGTITKTVIGDYDKFEILIKNSSLIADKTKLVEKIYHATSNAHHAFCFPQTFLKSVNMTMLRFFNEIKVDANGDALADPFSDPDVKEISRRFGTFTIFEPLDTDPREDIGKGFRKKQFGKRGAVYISLRRCLFIKSFEDFQQKFKECLQECIGHFMFIYKRLEEMGDNRDYRASGYYRLFKKLDPESEHQFKEHELTNCVQSIVEMIKWYFESSRDQNHRLLVLIDDYDDPIIGAFSSKTMPDGDAEKIRIFMWQFLESVRSPGMNNQVVVAGKFFHQDLVTNFKVHTLGSKYSLEKHFRMNEADFTQLCTHFVVPEEAQKLVKSWYGYKVKGGAFNARFLTTFLQNWSAARQPNSDGSASTSSTSPTKGTTKMPTPEKAEDTSGPIDIDATNRLFLGIIEQSAMDTLPEEGPEFLTSGSEILELVDLLYEIAPEYKDFIGTNLPAGEEMHVIGECFHNEKIRNQLIKLLHGGRIYGRDLRSVQFTAKEYEKLKQAADTQTFHGEYTGDLPILLFSYLYLAGYLSSDFDSKIGHWYFEVTNLLHSKALRKHLNIYWETLFKRYDTHIYTVSKAILHVIREFGTKREEHLWKPAIAQLAQELQEMLLKFPEFGEFKDSLATPSNSVAHANEDLFHSVFNHCAFRLKSVDKFGTEVTMRKEPGKTGTPRLDTSFLNAKHKIGVIIEHKHNSSKTLMEALQQALNYFSVFTKDITEQRMERVLFIVLDFNSKDRVVKHTSWHSEWTSILMKFYNEMPLKRHRRQLRMFNDSFMGREAVDFLFSFLPDLWPRECSRKTAVNLAKMFLKSGYLVNARNEEDREFYDNVALYGFCSSKIESFLNDVPVSSNETPAKSTSRNVRRISSFKADALESYRKGNENFGTLKWEQSKDVIKSAADYTSPAVPSGGLSMSCGDLTSEEMHVIGECFHNEKIRNQLIKLLHGGRIYGRDLRSVQFTAKEYEKLKQAADTQTFHGEYTGDLPILLFSYLYLAGYLSSDFDSKIGHWYFEVTNLLHSKALRKHLNIYWETLFKRYDTHIYTVSKAILHVIREFGTKREEHLWKPAIAQLAQELQEMLLKFPEFGEFKDSLATPSNSVAHANEDLFHSVFNHCAFRLKSVDKFGTEVTMRKEPGKTGTPRLDTSFLNAKHKIGVIIEHKHNSSKTLMEALQQALNYFSVFTKDITEQRMERVLFIVLDFNSKDRVVKHTSWHSEKISKKNAEDKTIVDDAEIEAKKEQINNESRTLPIRASKRLASMNNP